MYINPLKSELLTKQGCRDELVVYSLFFFLQQLIYVYMYIYHTIIILLYYILAHYIINYLITESEVVTGKSQTEALPY